MKNVYLAAQYDRKDELLTYRQDLYKTGHTCTSSWLDLEHTTNVQLLIHYAQQDLLDIMNCNLLIAFTTPPEQPIMRGGHVFEIGYAYGSGIPLYIVGPMQFIFCHLNHPNVRVFETWLDCMEVLRRG